MTWTPLMRRGAQTVALATVIFTILSLFYLWHRAQAVDDITFWAFAKLAIVVALVWAAIGATMGFFIVMILKKNHERSP